MLRSASTGAIGCLFEGAATKATQDLLHGTLVCTQHSHDLGIDFTGTWPCSTLPNILGQCKITSRVSAGALQQFQGAVLRYPVESTLAIFTAGSVYPSVPTISRDALQYFHTDMTHAALLCCCGFMPGKPKVLIRTLIFNKTAKEKLPGVTTLHTGRYPTSIVDFT